MAGAGYKLYSTGDVLSATDVNTYLQQQTVMVFASAAARTSALSAVLAEGMISYLQDTNATQVYNGTAWVSLAASPLTTKGDLYTYSTADARLGVGTNNQVLTADSAEATGLKWATPSAAASITLLSTTNITATTEISVTGISQDYTSLIILIQNYKSGTDNTTVTVRFNADTSSNYVYSIAGVTSGNVSGVSSVDIFGGAGMDNTANSSCTVIELPFYTSTASVKTGTVNSTMRQNDGYTWQREGGFGYIESTAISSFQWRNGAYNWAAQGTIKIYGVK